MSWLKKEREAAAARASSRRLQKKGDVESVLYEKMAAAAPDSVYEDLFTYVARRTEVLNSKKNYRQHGELRILSKAFESAAIRDFEAVEAFLKCSCRCTVRC